MCGWFHSPTYTFNVPLLRSDRDGTSYSYCQQKCLQGVSPPGRTTGSPEE
uniref:Uncharacterized protein n=1 Tax=Anguilla anguilla TaxID=7936 RepID=A0A0E9RHJ5_ANGAN